MNQYIIRLNSHQQSLYRNSCAGNVVMRVAIVGTPRSGSSYLAKSLGLAGYPQLTFNSSIQMSASQFNQDGYFEDVFFNLLNDQLIRLRFGLDYSFLYPPEISSVSVSNQNFSYDLDEVTVQIPNNYLSNIDFFCGQTWDVWGLSRMVDGQKWFRAYSRMGISTRESLLSALDQVRQTMINKQSFYVKDARLVFTLSFFKDIFSHIIFLTREQKGLKKSIQNHYGSRMFTGPNYEEFPWVSNHFNYRIRLMSFEDFLYRYTGALQSNTGTAKIIRVNLEDINDEEKLSRWLILNGFSN